MSTHNLCFRAKIREICIPLHTTILQYKSGVYFSRTCFPDENAKFPILIASLFNDASTLLGPLQKHVRVMYTPLIPPLLYSKNGVCMGIPIFLIFYSKS